MPWIIEYKIYTKLFLIEIVGLELERELFSIRCLSRHHEDLEAFYLLFSLWLGSFDEQKILVFIFDFIT